MKRKMFISITACVLVQLSVGIIYLWSIFSGKAVDAFSWTQTEARMVSSYMLLAYVCGNSIGGFVNDRRGPKFTCILGVCILAAGISASAFVTAKTVRLLYLTYCGLGGLGSGFAYGACISCLQKWLPDRRGLAAGIAVSAFGLSSVVFAPLSHALLGANTGADGIVDFRAMFLILGGIFFAVGIASCCFITLPDEKSLSESEASDRQKSYTLREAVRTSPFWYMFLYIFFSNGTWNLTVPLIRDLGMERGLTEAMAVMCVSLTGVFSAAGRLGAAAASDRVGRTNTAATLSAVTFVGALLLTVAPGYWYMAVVGLIAFAFGGPCAINAAICTDFFGTRYSGSVYGVMMLALGASSIAFNALANGFLGGRPVPTFLLAAAAAAAAVALMLRIGRLETRRRET